MESTSNIAITTRDYGMVMLKYQYVNEKFVSENIVDNYRTF